MSFVCEYLGLLELLRDLIVSLSRENHIKVLMLFVTIEICNKYLSSKTECILFPYRHLQQRPGE